MADQLQPVTSTHKVSRLRIWLPIVAAFTAGHGVCSAANYHSWFGIIIALGLLGAAADLQYWVTVND